MILDLDDTCWSDNNHYWQRELVELLVLLAIHEQHSVLATPSIMLRWCESHLNTHVDYFKTRLASAQLRANALRIQISPNGATSATGTPPWSLTARAACNIVNTPLRLVLENDQSDRKFVESTVPSFSYWCTRGWVAPAMGGGSAMEKDIKATSLDAVSRWRTFYLFDSDRLHPSELASTWTPPALDGCQGHKFESACISMPRERWHRLDRRSIENYLPESVLSAVNSGVTTTLFGATVGHMAKYYNMKKGLTGDGVSPPDPNKNVRASRNQGFWNSLPATDVKALERGFGSAISDEFTQVPQNHSWPADVILEMTALASALQDAI